MGADAAPIACSVHGNLVAVALVFVAAVLLLPRPPPVPNMAPREKISMGSFGG